MLRGIRLLVCMGQQYVSEATSKTCSRSCVHERVLPAWEHCRIVSWLDSFVTRVLRYSDAFISIDMFGLLVGDLHIASHMRSRLPVQDLRHYCCMQ